MTTSHTTTEETPLTNSLRIILRKIKWVLILFVVFTLIGAIRLWREPLKIELSARYKIVPHLPPNDVGANPVVVFSDADYESLNGLLASEALIDKVCKASNISRHQLEVRFNSMPQERMTNISVTAPSEIDSNRWLASLPKVFTKVVAYQIRTECARELSVLQRRESLIRRHLDLLARRHERLSQQSGNMGYQQTMIGDPNALEMNSRFLRERMRSAKNEHATLVEMLGKEHPYKTVAERTENPDYRVLTGRLVESKREKESLLVLYKPDHVRIRQLDAAIASMERRLSELSPYQVQSKHLDNPHYQYLLERELEKRFEMERLSREALSVAGMDSDRIDLLHRRRDIAGELKRVETDLSAFQDEDLRLLRAISMIELYRESSRAPLRRVSEHPEVSSVSPQPLREGAGVILLSALFAVMIVLSAEKWFHRVDSPEEAMHILHMDECVVIPKYSGASNGGVNGFHKLYDRLLERTGDDCSKYSCSFNVDFLSWGAKSGKSFIAEKLCQLLNDQGYDAVVEISNGFSIKTERFQSKRLDAARSLCVNVSYILRDVGNLETMRRNNEIPEWEGVVCFVVPHGRCSPTDLTRAYTILNRLSSGRLILIYNRAPLDCC